MESDTSVSVTWMESATTSSQHLPDDTYTVTLTPNCTYRLPTEPTLPPPQTVPYDATPLVEITNLGMVYNNNVCK